MVTSSKMNGLNPVLISDYSFFSDRVRAISVAMGLTPIIWTRISPTATFDTGGICFYVFHICT